MVIFATDAQKGVLLHQETDFDVEEVDQYQIKSTVLDSATGTVSKRPAQVIDIRLLPQMGGDV